MCNLKTILLKAGSSEKIASKEAESTEKRKELLAANKAAARAMLIGLVAGTESSYTRTIISNR